MLLLTGKQAKLNDDFTQNKIGIPGLVLMERAALSIAERIEALIEEDINRFNKRRLKVIAVAGMGNNGGDAVAAARILSQRNIKTSVALIGNPEKTTESMKKQLEIAGNLYVDTECCFVPDGDRSKTDTFKSIVDSADIIIDGLFGVGLSRDLDAHYCEIIKLINESPAYKIAVDIPSGIDCDTGWNRGEAVRCDETITFGFMKYGLAVNEGRGYGGKVTVKEIGLEVSTDGYDEDDITYRAIPDERMKILLPHRSQSSNKGTYGKVLIIAGNDEIYGAAFLSAAAAYKSGAGLVKLFTSEVNRDNLMRMLPEAMISCYKKDEALSDKDIKSLKESIKWADAIVVGPGLGTDERSRKILEILVSQNGFGKILIMDADAINICASADSKGNSGIELLKKASGNYPDKLVITPHIAEMARLVNALKKEDGKSDDVDAFKDVIKAVRDNMGETAIDIAEKFRMTVVLKDARTHIAAHSRQREVYVNLTGNSGMSTGGSGDVLTGIIAGFTAGIHGRTDSGMGHFAQTVALAVKVHGAAGDAAKKSKGERGMLAGDIIDGLCSVLV